MRPLLLNLPSSEDLAGGAESLWAGTRAGNSSGIPSGRSPLPP